MMIHSQTLSHNIGNIFHLFLTGSSSSSSLSSSSSSSSTPSSSSSSSSSSWPPPSWANLWVRDPNVSDFSRPPGGKSRWRDEGCVQDGKSTPDQTQHFITSDFAGLCDYITSGFQTFWPFKKMCLKAYSFLPTARISISNVSVGVDFPALDVRRHFFANIDRGALLCCVRSS